jgi:hypothetical protein
LRNAIGPGLQVSNRVGFSKVKIRIVIDHGEMVGARGFEPPTLQSRIDYQHCPSLLLNDLWARCNTVFHAVLDLLSPICSQFDMLPFIIIYDILRCR